MADVETKQVSADEKPGAAKRVHYEKPVLVRLGSVDRLTLGVSAGNVSDTGGKLKNFP